jgi:hypothetical protein
VLISAPIHAQYSEKEWQNILSNYSNEELLMESSNLLEVGYYAAAERLIDKILTTETNNNNVNYRKGFILSEAKQNYSDAIPYLEKAKSSAVKNYDATSKNETGAPLDVYYFLAKCYHRTGNVTKARENYNQFLSTASNKTEIYDRTNVALLQLEEAERLAQNKKRNVEVVNIGNAVNTGAPEYSPVISFDGSALYFTSRRKWENGDDKIERDPTSDFYPEDIYVSYKNGNNEWTEPVRLDFCGEDQNEASVSVSPNERKIYVYQDIVGNGDMFYSEFRNNKFGKIVHYENKDVNTEKFWETHCIVTPDGKNIYFASQREGGYGGRDLYRLVKLPDGTWSQPQNLGPTINTQFDEDAPFMSIDNKTLYFASNGPKSIGGFDIFVSIIDRDNQWTDPINLGFPINSYDDDLFYTETIDGRQGFITSKRSDTYGDKDIYQINNDYLNRKYGHILKGNITTKSGDPLPEDIVISLKCTNCESDIHDLTSYPRLRDGSYLMNLEPCRNYDVIFARKDGTEEFHKTDVSTDCELDFEELVRNAVIDTDNWTVTIPGEKDTIPVIVDTPVVVTPVIVFNPLQFKHNYGYNLNKISTADGDLSQFVNQVEEQLKQGKQGITISVFSSASKVPTKRFKNNQVLAQSRAANIESELNNYFKAKGISSVTVKIVSVVVSGPEYNADHDSEEKYIPYQFIELKTE